MQSNEYQKLAMVTANAATNDTPEKQILNCALGLIGEGGEIADSVVTDNLCVNMVLALAAHVGTLADGMKKVIYQGHTFDHDDARLTIRLIRQVLDGCEMDLMVWNEQAPVTERLTADDKKHVEKELGDLAWYVAQGATAINVPLAEVLRGNISKLQKRYGGKFSAEASRNRSE